MHMPRLKRQILTLLACMAIVLTGTAAMAANYYVSPSGNDGNNGSSSAPWKSISHAASAAKSSGDVINVLAGDYTDNNTAVLAPGVSIKGAGRDKTVIRTSAGTYIRAESSGTPVINGNNTISGLRFIGNGGNTAVSSIGRSFQRITGNSFESFDKAISLYGKVWAWNGSCGGRRPGNSANYCDDDARTSTQPNDNEWARGVVITNNQLTNCKMFPNTIKDSEISYNTINNNGILKSAVGKTALWWDNVDFHHNELYTQTISWEVIACEVWMVQNNTKFRDNKTNGWFSIIKNPNGPRTPWSWQIVNNTFSSNVPVGVGSAGVRAAIEACFHVENVLVEGNYVENTGSNMTYAHGLGIWGYGINRNFHVRNNVFRNMRSDGILISTTDTYAQLFDGDNIHVYNNTFDGLNGGKSQGIYVEDGAGDVDQITVRNNIFMGAANAVLVSANHSVSGIQVTNNMLYNTGSANVDYGSGAFSNVAANIFAQPQFANSGNRPYPYYKPSGDKSNIIDKGVNVGLPYRGAAPDLGAYEYVVVAPPSNVRVIKVTQ